MACAKRLEAFFLVLHIINVRYDMESDILLPTPLFQQLHTGRFGNYSRG